MKFSIVLSYFLMLIFAVGCSKNNVVSSDSSNSHGSISLNIDKANTPSDVVAVIAYLTRENYETLSGFLNLLSDSSADISFQSIPIGTWHLKVDAINKDSMVIYSGTSDVKVQESILTQINLTLIPTGSGTGNVYIYVTWGNSQNTAWTDYSGNPIFTVSQSPNSPNSLLHSKVLFENGRYKMWYTNLYNSAVSDIWYAESSNGINWIVNDSIPAIQYGLINSWDYLHVQSGAIIKDANEYKMYYLGFSDQIGNWNIGLATSQDGINWNKHSTPIIYADSNEYQIGPNDIIKIGSKYLLYYSSRNYPYYDIRLAISEDGIHFSKYEGNPILSADKAWESTGVANASVIYDNNQYKMVYMNALANGFGIAYSEDGIHWLKDSTNPIFKLGNTHNNWCSKIAYPYWRKINGQYRIYYTGNMGGYDQAIGMIYK